MADVALSPIPASLAGLLSTTSLAAVTGQPGDPFAQHLATAAGDQANPLLSAAILTATNEPALVASTGASPSSAARDGDVVVDQSSLAQEAIPSDTPDDDDALANAIASGPMAVLALVPVAPTPAASCSPSERAPASDIKGRRVMDIVSVPKILIAAQTVPTQAAPSVPFQQASENAPAVTANPRDQPAESLTLAPAVTNSQGGKAPLPDKLPSRRAPVEASDPPASAPPVSTPAPSPASASVSANIQAPATQLATLLTTVGITPVASGSVDDTGQTSPQADAAAPTAETPSVRPGADLRPVGIAAQDIQPTRMTSPTRSRAEIVAISRRAPAETRRRIETSVMDSAPADFARPSADTRSNSSEAIVQDAGPRVGPQGDHIVEQTLSIARDGAWLDTLARDIALSAGADNDLRFKLEPQNLGSLMVAIKQGAEGASIRLTADTETTRNILIDAQPKLIAEARAQGLKVSETHVDLSHQQSSNPDSARWTQGNGSNTGTPNQQNRQSSPAHQPFVSNLAGKPGAEAESSSGDSDALYA